MLKMFLNYLNPVDTFLQIKFNKQKEEQHLLVPFERNMYTLYLIVAYCILTSRHVCTKLVFPLCSHYAYLNG